MELEQNATHLKTTKIPRKPHNTSPNSGTKNHNREANVFNHNYAKIQNKKVKNRRYYYWPTSFTGELQLVAENDALSCPPPIMRCKITSRTQGAVDDTVKISLAPLPPPTPVAPTINFTEITFNYVALGTSTSPE